MTANTTYANFDAVAKEAATLGRSCATGKLKPMEFAVLIATAARDGTISPDADKKAGEDHIATLWGKFSAADEKNAKAGLTKADDSNTTKKFVSNCRTIARASIKTGVDLPATFDRLRPMMNGEGVKKAKPWDHFYAVAAAQLKLTRALDEAKLPQRDLTDAELKVVLCGDDEPTDAADKAAKEELEVLERELVVLRKISSGTEAKGDKPGKPAYPSIQLDKAIEALETRVSILTLARGK
jgi:hypothetical protein